MFFGNKNKNGSSVKQNAPASKDLPATPQDAAGVNAAQTAIPAWGRSTSSSASAFSSAVNSSQANANKEQDPYETVLEMVKDELKTGRRITNAAYENPNDEDYAIVTDVARRQIQIYNVAAPSNGLPLLIEGNEGEVTAELERIAKRMSDDVLGWGPIAPFMADPMIEEIFINGHRDIYIQRAGEGIQKVNSTFRSEYALRLFINNKLDYGSGGRGVTVRTPYRDHRLRDGSRVHVIMDPLVSNLGYSGIAITIRRFRSVARNLKDLVSLGTLTPQAANFLRACVHAQLNICISGGTGTGKTTLLSAFTSEIDPADRIVTVEDTPELQLQHLPNWVALVTRERGEQVEPVTMADNVRHCLRMRPRRILLGEARGPEMIAILEAMNTGHDGCMFTVHADDAYRTLQRIETLYLKGGLGNVPALAIRREIAQAVQLIVNIGIFRLSDGREVRRVREINFVTGNVEGDLITHEPIFQWVHEHGKDESTGHLEFMNAYPSQLIRRLEQRLRGFSWERDIERATNWQ